MLVWTISGYNHHKRLPEIVSGYGKIARNEGAAVTGDWAKWRFCPRPYEKSDLENTRKNSRSNGPLTLMSAGRPPQTVSDFATERVLKFAADFSHRLAPKQSVELPGRHCPLIGYGAGH